MSAPDRLPELLRQRELIKEQLAWIEREIAAASDKAWPPVPGVGEPTASKPLKPSSTPANPSPPPAVKAAAEFDPVLAEEIIDQYRVAPGTLQTDLRKGCLLYFFGALALVALGVALLYYAFKYAN